VGGGAGRGILPGVTDLLTGTGQGPLLEAATVILLRDGAAGLECLMLRKTKGQAFGGLWVFPGGRVEDSDGAGYEGALAAAVRESAEETGLALDATTFVPFSHWTPPLRAPKRYLTWFFIAPLPEGADDVVIDGGEIGDQMWTRPGDALAAHARNEVELLPPTWVTLNRLAQANTVEDAMAEAAARPEERFTTYIAVSVDGVMVAMWDPDVAYPADPLADIDPTLLTQPGPRHRLTMDPAGWRYERSD
jgi:8-oxo-dGTP pyrophosphatase MutT (NUDIX family)